MHQHPDPPGPRPALPILRDKGHLVRLALLFVAGTVLFLIVRHLLVPKGYGDLGPFRPGALADSRAHPLVFAGEEACADCHEDRKQERAGGAHASVHCEACHGALAAHAADPTAVAATKPDARTLCPVCHRKDPARPAGFPQVDIGEHAGGSSCTDCHAAHKPGLA